MKQDARGRVRLTAILLPVAHGANRQMKRVSELRLRLLHALADSFHVYRFRDAPARNVTLCERNCVLEASSDLVECFTNSISPSLAR